MGWGCSAGSACCLGDPAPYATTRLLSLPETLTMAIQRDNAAKPQTHKPIGSQVSHPQIQALPLLKVTLPLLPGTEQGNGSGLGVAPSQAA